MSSRPDAAIAVATATRDAAHPDALPPRPLDIEPNSRHSPTIASFLGWWMCGRRPREEKKNDYALTPRRIYATYAIFLFSLLSFLAGMVFVILSAVQEHQQLQPASLQDTSQMVDPTNNGLLLSPTDLNYSQITYQTIREQILSDLQRTVTTAEVKAAQVALSVPKSPQAKALKWLAHDKLKNGGNMPSDEIQDPHDAVSSKISLLERYALAVMYYHWDGPHWNFVHLGTDEPEIDGIQGLPWSPHMSSFPLSSEGSRIPECDWYGVDCVETINGTQTVTSLNFTSRRVFTFSSASPVAVFASPDDHLVDSGDSERTWLTAIPTEIGLLSSLRHLYVPDHGLTGGVPIQLYRLTDLQTFDVTSNLLTGPVLSPYAFRNGTATEKAGMVPLIGQLSNLQVLRLGYNELEEDLTERLGNDEIVMSYQTAFQQLTDLRVFDVQACRKLTADKNLFWGNGRDPQGTSSNGLGVVLYWPHLEELHLSETRIEIDMSLLPLELRESITGGARQTSLVSTSNVPFALSDTWWSRMRLLQGSESPVSGPFPKWLGWRCNKLEQLSFGNPVPPTPGFEGTLPTELGLLTDLVFLFTKRNSGIESTLPTEIGLLTNLKVLSMSMMVGLHGPIPTEIGNMLSLEVIHFDLTFLSGAIPPEIAYPANLFDVRLGNTRLSGTVPLAFCPRNLPFLEADCPRLKGDEVGFGMVECECCTQCFGGYK